MASAETRSPREPRCDPRRPRRAATDRGGDRGRGPSVNSLASNARFAPTSIPPLLQNGSSTPRPHSGAVPRPRRTRPARGRNRPTGSTLLSRRHPTGSSIRPAIGGSFSSLCNLLRAAEHLAHQQLEELRVDLDCDLASRSADRALCGPCRPAIYISHLVDEAGLVLVDVVLRKKQRAKVLWRSSPCWLR